MAGSPPPIVGVIIAIVASPPIMPVVVIIRWIPPSRGYRYHRHYWHSRHGYKQPRENHYYSWPMRQAQGRPANHP
jgi:hypothetical protein